MKKPVEYKLTTDDPYMIPEKRKEICIKCETTHSQVWNWDTFTHKGYLCSECWSKVGKTGMNPLTIMSELIEALEQYKEKWQGVPARLILSWNSWKTAEAAPPREKKGLWYGEKFINIPIDISHHLGDGIFVFSHD